jgi:hypothetical protein
MRVFCHRRSLVVVLAGLVLAAGCGTDDDRPSGSSGDVPITQRAIAAVALEHLPDDTTSRRATSTTPVDDPKGSLGADLRYGGDAETQGDRVRVFISPEIETDDVCPDEILDGCIEQPVDGGTLVITWQEEEPEEDPGFVAVTFRRADVTISTGWSGDAITGDPREQDLKISVRAMEDLVQDDRLGLTTSQATIDAGEALDDWEGGGPDPNATLDPRTPSTDDSLVNAYWSAHGGHDAFSDRRPLPMTKQLGLVRTGGRFTAAENPDQPERTIDVVVAIRPPPWMADDPCASKRLAGHCVAESKGRYFAWVPGAPGAGGEVWMFTVRDDVFVAVHTSGFEVPDDEEAARVQADWFFVDDFLLSDTMGLTTNREMLDMDFD